MRQKKVFVLDCSYFNDDMTDEQFVEEARINGKELTVESFIIAFNEETINSHSDIVRYCIVDEIDPLSESLLKEINRTLSNSDDIAKKEGYPIALGYMISTLKYIKSTLSRS